MRHYIRKPVLLFCLALFLSFSKTAFCQDSMGGAGLYGSLIPFSMASEKIKVEISGTEDEDEGKVKMKFGGGFGLFGEFNVLPYLAVGGEAYFGFFKIREYENGYDYECDDLSPKPRSCKVAHIFFAGMVRVKAPIKVHKLVAPYPLVSLGIGNITYRFEDFEGDNDSKNYTGLAYSIGAGVEFYPIKIIKPCFEFRYMGGALWDKSEHDTMAGRATVKETVVFHGIIINLGVRFL